MQFKTSSDEIVSLSYLERLNVKLNRKVLESHLNSKANNLALIKSFSFLILEKRGFVFR